MEPKSLNLSRADLRTWLDRGLSLAALAAKFTPTPKDDAAVALLRQAVDNDAVFSPLCDLLGLPA